MRSLTVARPLAASLILFGLVAASGGAVAAALADLSAAQAERDAQADLLAHGIDARRRATSAGATSPAPDPFVTAESETLAAAAVDATLRDLAERTRCVLLSSRAEVTSGDDATRGTNPAARRIGVEAVIEGDNDALQAALIGLEGGTTTLLVDRLEIAPAGGEGDPAAPTAGSPRLHMVVALSAYWRAPGSRRPAETASGTAPP